MRKDILAAGSRTAQFSAGSAKPTDAVKINKGILSSEPRQDVYVLSKPAATKRTVFTPLYDRLLVKQDDAQSEFGGLILTDTIGDKPLQGKVISVGPGVRENGGLRPLSVTAGNHVLFGKYAGTEIKLDGWTFLILNEEDVLGTVREESVIGK